MQQRFFDISPQSLAVLRGPLHLPNELYRNTLLQSTAAYSNLKGSRPCVTIAEHAGVTYVSFPGTSSLSDWEVNCQFGQTEAPTLLEPSCKVHKGFISRFARVCESAQYKRFCQSVQAGDVPLVVFTGHSLGGAVAALAALSFLSRQKNGDFTGKGSHTDVLCITYGAPMVGNLDLQKVVLSSGWHDNFVHVVTRHDMVPRIFIAMRKGMIQEVAAGIWQLSGGALSPEDQAVQGAWDRKKDSRSAPLTFIQRAVVFWSMVKSTASILYVVCVSTGQAFFRTEYNYRPFGHILDDGGLYSDSATALRHLWLTRYQRDGPDVSRSPALFGHGLAAYWDLVQDYRPAAGSGQRLKALQHDANSEFERGLAQAFQEAKEEMGRKLNQMASRLGAGDRTLMTEWREDIEPLSDRLEAWTSAFRDPQRAYDVFRCSPINGAGSHKTIDQARRRIMHFWNDVEAWVRHQGPDSTGNLDPNLLQRGQTWRTNFEMLDIANYYRRKLWTGHAEGRAHYLESDNRPAAYAMLEQLAEPNLRHADSTAFARQEQAAIQGANSALNQLLQAAKDWKAAPQQDVADTLQAAGQHALQAVQACTLPLTEERLRKVLLNYDLDPQLPGQMQQPAQSSLPAAVEGVIKQFWDRHCENEPLSQDGRGISS